VILGGARPWRFDLVRDRDGAAQEDRDRAFVRDFATYFLQDCVVDVLEPLDDGRQMNRSNASAFRALIREHRGLGYHSPRAAPRRPIVEHTPIPKHVACEAASNSSGVVFPGGSPDVIGKETGSSNAPLPAPTVPLPPVTPPSHRSSERLEKVAIEIPPC
jgi:hypothetical protein